MTTLGLFFVGSVLLVNGLALLGVVDQRASAPLNLFVGTLLLVAAARISLPISDVETATDEDAVLTSVGFVLFGFTYLYVAILGFTGGSPTGLGWYCFWAATVAVFLAVVSFSSDDPRTGTLWSLWAILFAFFFVLMGLGVERVRWATGWVTLVESVSTTTLPAAVTLLGLWERVSGVVVVALGVAMASAFAVLALRPR